MKKRILLVLFLGSMLFVNCSIDEAAKEALEKYLAKHQWKTVKFLLISNSNDSVRDAD